MVRRDNIRKEDVHTYKHTHTQRKLKKIMCLTSTHLHAPHLPLLYDLLYGLVLSNESYCTSWTHTYSKKMGKDINEARTHTQVKMVVTIELRCISIYEPGKSKQGIKCVYTIRNWRSVEH